MLASYLVNQVAVARLSAKKLKAAGANARVSDFRMICNCSTHTESVPRVWRVRPRMKYQKTSKKKHHHHKRS